MGKNKILMNSLCSSRKSMVDMLVKLNSPEKLKKSRHPKGSKESTVPFLPLINKVSQSISLTNSIAV